MVVFFLAGMHIYFHSTHSLQRKTKGRRASNVHVHTHNNNNNNKNRQNNTIANVVGKSI
jgi:hypothetical protein